MKSLSSPVFEYYIDESSHIVQITLNFELSFRSTLNSIFVQCLSPSALSSAEVRTGCSADPRPTSPPRNSSKNSDQKSRLTAGTASASTASATSAMASPHPNSIVNKPARGWLHPDHLFAKDGINYNVRVSQQKNILSWSLFLWTSKWRLLEARFTSGLQLGSGDCAPF